MPFLVPLFRRTEARFETPTDRVGDRLRRHAAARGIDVAADRLDGTYDGGLFASSFAWYLEEGDHVTVVERHHISWWWYATVWLAGTGVLGALVLDSFLGALTVLFGLCTFGVLIADSVRYPSPIAEATRTNEGFVVVPVGRDMLLVTFLLLGMFVMTYPLFSTTAAPPGAGWVDVVGTVLPYLLLVTWFATFVYIPWGGREDTRPAIRPIGFLSVERDDRQAQIVNEYATVLVVANLPVGLLGFFGLVGADPFGFAVFVRTYDVLPMVLAGILFLAGLLTLLLWSVTRTRMYVKRSLIEGTESVDGRLVLTVAIGLIALLSWLVLFAGYLTVTTFGPVLARAQVYPVFALILVVSLVPTLYFVVGLVYQTATHLVELLRLFRRSTPWNDPVAEAVDARVRLLHASAPSGLSYHIGLRRYIFVSEDLPTFLDDDELLAVLAHEEGHIVNGDALLAFLLPFLALVLGTGKNVVYSLFEYRDREFEADQYAADHVGATTLSRALRKLLARAALSRGVAPSMRVAASPFLGEFYLHRPGETYWGVLYGSLAVAEAHPRIGERLSRLDDRPEEVDDD